MKVIKSPPLFEWCTGLSRALLVSDWWIVTVFVCRRCIRGQAWFLRRIWIQTQRYQGSTSNTNTVPLYVAMGCPSRCSKWVCYVGVTTAVFLTMLLFLVLQHPATVSFQKAKADPHVSSAFEVRTRKWSLILRLIITYVFISNKCWIPLILQDKNDIKWIAEEYDTSSATKNSSVKIRDHVIATTWKDGPYLLVVKIESSKPEANWSLTGETF